MSTLVTGSPGSGKTTLVKYSQSLGDKRFVDADEIKGLCLWKEFKTGKLLGSVESFPKPTKDEWYKKYGWYWNLNLLKKFITKSPNTIVCGSSENTEESYKLFDTIFILKKTENELLSNLQNPLRINPFGKTPEQRKNFLSWQSYFIEKAKTYNSIIICGNDIAQTYLNINNKL